VRLKLGKLRIAQIKLVILIIYRAKVNLNKVLKLVFLNVSFYLGSICAALSCLLSRVATGNRAYLLT